MADTFTLVADDVIGSKRVVVMDITTDSYTAGGIACTGKVPLRRIASARRCGGNAAANNYLWMFDTTNKKIVASYPTGGDATSPASVADPTVVTTPDAGSTGLTGSAAKPALAGVVTPGRGKEVKASTDLSSLTVRFEFTGE